MLELYKIGLCVSVCLFVVVVGLLGFFIADQSGAKNLFEYLDHMGSFLSGVGGIATAGVAFAGIAAWKKQLIHGKQLEVIWAAQVSLRELSSLLRHGAMLEVLDQSTEWGKQELERHEKALETAKERFKSACTHLDKLLTGAQGGWGLEPMVIFGAWNNYWLYVRQQRAKGVVVTPLKADGAEKWAKVQATVRRIEVRLDALRDSYT